MVWTRWGVIACALALATAAGAQSSGQSDTQGDTRTGGQGRSSARCADPCQACMSSIQGTGSASSDACPNACAQCDRQRQARAGQSSAQPGTGSDVRTSLDSAGRSISNAVNSAASDVGRNIDQARSSGMAARTFGPGAYRQTLITDIVGTFTGQGLNVEYQRPMADRISGVVGANYSRTTSTTGSLTSFGGEVGLDYFPFGVAGYGLRVGPRASLQLGQESVDHSRFFTDFGLGGEVGYNWVGASGLSLQVAGGLGGRVGGALTSGLDTRLGGDFGPYGKVNVGWSW